MKTQYKRWQVILGVIGFLLIMGAVGKIDQDSRQAVLDEKINIRDRVRQTFEHNERAEMAFYNERARK